MRVATPDDSGRFFADRSIFGCRQYIYIYSSSSLKMLCWAKPLLQRSRACRERTRCWNMHYRNDYSTKAIMIISIMTMTITTRRRPTALIILDSLAYSVSFLNSYLAARSADSTTMPRCRLRVPPASRPTSYWRPPRARCPPRPPAEPWRS